MSYRANSVSTSLPNMPSSGLRRRIDKARTFSPRDKQDHRTRRSHRPQHVNRQGEVPPPSVSFPTPPSSSSRPGPPPFFPSVSPPALRPPLGVPDNDFAPGDDTSDDDGGDSEGEDNFGDEGDGKTENPFAPTGSTPSQPQESIAASTTTSNPFASDLINSIASSTQITAPSTASTTIATSMSTGQFYQTPTDTALAGTYTAYSTTLASSGLNAASNTVLAAPASTSTIPSLDVPQASNHPIAKAAVVVPAVFGSVAAIAAIYLLFRYCTPVRARWAIYRASRGQRISEEEEARTPATAPQMTQVYATNTVDTSRGSSEQLSLPSTPITPATSIFRGTAVALPITTTRVPPPVLVRNFSKRAPQNSPPDQAIFSRSNSGNAEAAPSEEYGTYAFNFNVAEYATSESSNGHSRHPSGLENNPPTPVARKAIVISHLDGADAMPNVNSIGSGSELGIFPLPPATPLAAHFRPETPPESMVNYSPQRLRKSITPSESVSNIPDSPFPMTPGLMPPVPILNSRWSNNSSSVHGGLLAEAMNMGPGQSGDMGVGPNGRPLSRFPSLQSSSSPVRGTSKLGFRETLNS